MMPLSWCWSVQVLSWVCVNGLFTLIKVFIARLLARAGGHAHLLQLGRYPPSTHASTNLMTTEASQAAIRWYAVCPTLRLPNRCLSVCVVMAVRVLVWSPGRVVTQAW